LVQQLCTGLGAAHALGIIHRDIKLENLLLADPQGQRALKILDFGIAKLLPEADPSTTPAPPAVPSQEGVLVGTPQFLSPEQVLCHAVDVRTDVYGAAMVLYELIVGRSPFAHRTELLSLLEAHVSEPPRPPSEVAPQPVEPAIDDVVLRALSKRPEDRYASAAEFAAALDHALALKPASPLDPRSVVPTLPPRAKVSASLNLPGLFVLVAVGAAVVSVVVSTLLFRLR
jgi:serine/threonine-protein kinase